MNIFVATLFVDFGETDELIAVFSDLDKALAYADGILLGSKRQMDIYEMKVDDPTYIVNRVYSRHG